MWLYDNIIFTWPPESLPRGVRRVAKWCKSEAQLGLDLGRKSKIRDGYAERKDRPRGAAVADFRFTSPYEPQLRPQSTRFTRTDPVPNSKANRVVLRVQVQNPIIIRENPAKEPVKVREVLFGLR